MYTHKNEVIEHYVPSPNKVDKKGRPVFFRRVVRKMLLTNPEGVLVKEYRITQVQRRGITYSVTGKFLQTKLLWEIPSLDATPVPLYQWKKVEKSMNRTELVKWLSDRMSNAELALHQLETAEPIKFKDIKEAA